MQCRVFTQHLHNNSGAFSRFHPRIGEVAGGASPCEAGLDDLWGVALEPLPPLALEGRDARPTCSCAISRFWRRSTSGRDTAACPNPVSQLPQPPAQRPEVPDVQTAPSAVAVTSFVLSGEKVKWSARSGWDLPGGHILCLSRDRVGGQRRRRIPRPTVCRPERSGADSLERFREGDLRPACRPARHGSDG